MADTTTGADLGADPAPDPDRRPLGMSLLLGVVIGIATAAIVYFLIAIPIYLVASFESNGLDRPIIRTGLFRVAMPISVVVGLVTGVVSGRWLRRGERWSLDDGGDRYSNR